MIAAVSGLLALTVWLPYLLKVVGGSPAASGTALHYLPEAGAHLPLPMIHFSLTGALCLLGTIWLVARASTSRRAQALGVGVVAIYLWSLLSMAFTVLGSTLLSFRLEPVLIVLLGAAGVFGFVEFAGWLVLATSDNPRVKGAVLVIGVLGALSFVQNIPKFLDSDIAVAYTDTDGNGERADQRPPDAAAHYTAVDELIQAQVPRARDDTVVLTADTSFLSFYPYLGFQALTSHYSNPLADFAGRARTISEWSELETPDQLVTALDTAPWRAPDAFVFRQAPTGTRCGSPRTCIPTTPTCAATPSRSRRNCSTTLDSRYRRPDRSWSSQETDRSVHVYLTLPAGTPHPIREAGIFRAPRGIVGSSRGAVMPDAVEPRRAGSGAENYLLGTPAVRWSCMPDSS